MSGRPTRFDSAPAEGTDTAVVLCTSGTTGRSDGAELTHVKMLLNALTCHRLLGTADHDVHLVSLPLFHTSGRTVQRNARLAAGATLVLISRFAPATVLALLEREKVTFFARDAHHVLGTPRQRPQPLRHPRCRGPPAHGGLLGPALPGDVLEQSSAVFGIRRYEGYGLSGTSTRRPVQPAGRTGETRIRRPLRQGPHGCPVSERSPRSCLVRRAGREPVTFRSVRAPRACR
ncbi:AMP-binding protein [Streptomyces sp. NPDC003016]